METWLSLGIHGVLIPGRGHRDHGFSCPFYKRQSAPYPRTPHAPLESKARQSEDVTSRTPKLVRWLQVQVVSFSLLSLTEQPSDDQPPLPPRGHGKECLSLQKGHCTNHCSFLPIPLSHSRLWKSYVWNLPFLPKSQNTHLTVKSSCNRRTHYQ